VNKNATSNVQPIDLNSGMHRHVHLRYLSGNPVAALQKESRPPACGTHPSPRKLQWSQTGIVDPQPCDTPLRQEGSDRTVGTAIAVFSSPSVPTHSVASFIAMASLPCNPMSLKN